MPVFNAHAADIRFPGEGLSLHLFRDNDRRMVRGGYGPAEQGQQLVFDVDVPVIWHDWSGGMGATQVRDQWPGSYAYGTNVCTREPGVVMPAGLATSIDITAITALTGAGEIRGSFELLGNVYFLVGRYVIKIASLTDPGPISATPERDLGSGNTAYSAAVFDGDAYIGLTGGGFINRLSSAGSWSASTDAAKKHLATVYWVTSDGTGSYRLIGTASSSAPTTFQHIASGSTVNTEANWSAAIKVGNNTHPINSVVAANQHVWFCTAGGVADVDGRGYSPILNPYMAQQYDASLNGEASLYSGGYVYVSTVQGLDRVDVSSAIRRDNPSYCQPGSGLGNETPIYGRCVALTTEGGWIVAAFYNGTDSYVCYGRDRGEMGIPGPGPMVWHGAEYYLAGERITHLRYTSGSPAGASQPCIWVCSYSGTTAKLRYLSIPKAASPLQELLNNLNSSGTYTGTHRWSLTGSLYLSDQDWNDQNNRKALLAYYSRNDRLTTSTYLRVFARVDGSSTYVQQGSGADPKMTTVPRSELLAVEAGLDRTTKGHNIGLRLDLVGTSTAPPVVREFKARAKVLPELRDSRQYQIDLGEPTSMRNSGIDQRSAASVYRQLVALQNREPLDFHDEMGQDLKVLVNPGITYEEVQIRREGPSKDSRRLVASLSLSVVPTSQAALALDSNVQVSPTVTNPFTLDSSALDGSDVLT